MAAAGPGTRKQSRRWDEHQSEMRSEFRRVYDAIKAVADKQEQSIGALGAR